MRDIWLGSVTISNPNAYACSIVFKVTKDPCRFIVRRCWAIWEIPLGKMGFVCLLEFSFHLNSKCGMVFTCVDGIMFVNFDKRIVGLVIQALGFGNI